MGREPAQPFRIVDAFGILGGDHRLDNRGAGQARDVGIDHRLFA